MTKDRSGAGASALQPGSWPALCFTLAAALLPPAAALSQTLGPNLNLTKAAGNQYEPAVAINPSNTNQIFMASRNEVGGLYTGSRALEASPGPAGSSPAPARPPPAIFPAPMETPVSPGMRLATSSLRISPRVPPARALLCYPRPPLFPKPSAPT